MKILHISDLHQLQGTSLEQEAFCDKMTLELSGQNIDLCVFSGDLLHQCKGSYRDVLDWLVKHLLTPLSVTKLLITCGNHDVNRHKVMPMFANYIDTLTTNDLLNQFVAEDASEQFSSNLEHVEAYNSAVSSTLKPLHFSPLYYVDEMRLGDKRVALVSLNTAWTALGQGKDDYGDLIFPTTFIHEIIDKVKEFDFKILCTHYPTAYLKEFNRVEIETLLYKHFDCCFVGHAHRISKSLGFFSSLGMLSCMAPAALSKSANAPGFVLLDVDLADYRAVISEFRYVEANMLSQKPVEIRLPVDNAKRDAIALKDAIRNKHATIKANASRIVVPFGYGDVDFQELFTEPVLKRHERLHDITRLSPADTRPSNNAIIPSSSLMNGENYVVFGKEKSGKTVLLIKLCLDYLRDFDFLHVLPLYIDLKPYYRNQSYIAKIDLKGLVRQEYNLSSRRADVALSTCKVVLLLDNLDLSFMSVNSLLVEILQSRPNVGFTATVNLIPESSVVHEFDALTYNEIYIRDISRKEIRTLADKWPSLRRYDKNEVIEKLTTIFTQLSIHFNYWTVSLFLWIFEKTSVVDIHDNVELIDLYVENLLDRPNLALGPATLFSFDNYKDFLSELAYLLYSSGTDNDYTLSYSEVVGCFERFKEANIRIVADARTTIEYLLEKGVIVRVLGDRYTFRLNGVLEYFLAHFMLRNRPFREQVLSNELLFLSFSNELEIYSGLVRTDSDLLSDMYINALAAIDSYLSRYPDYKNVAIQSNIDAKLIEELGSMAGEIAAGVQPLETEARDELQDTYQPIVDVQSEVRVKPHYSLSAIDTDLLARHLFLLSRIFRSMDAVLDKKLIQEVFGFILTQGCLLPFYVLRDLGRESQHKSRPSFVQEVVKIFSPIMSHMFLQDAVGHRNLETLVLQQIKDLSESADDNLYKLFVLHFLVIENDIRNNLRLVDSLIELCSRNRFLMHCLILKLISYIVFKCDGKPLELELKNRILRAHRMVNPGDRTNRIVQRVDKLKVQQGIEVNEPG